MSHLRSNLLGTSGAANAPSTAAPDFHEELVIRLLAHEESNAAAHDFVDACIDVLSAIKVQLERGLTDEAATLVDKSIANHERFLSVGPLPKMGVAAARLRSGR